MWRENWSAETRPAVCWEITRPVKKRDSHSTLIGFLLQFLGVFFFFFFFSGSSEMAEMTKTLQEEQDRMDDDQSAGANPTLSM